MGKISDRPQGSQREAGAPQPGIQRRQGAIRGWEPFSGIMKSRVSIFMWGSAGETKHWWAAHGAAQQFT